MEDMERYGDYNEVDAPPGGNKNPVLTVLKLLVGAVCLVVVGFLLFRIFLSDYYPAEVKQVYYNDTLHAYLDSVGGEAVAKTQRLRFPYDDNDLGNFFCEHLAVIEGAGQLQIAVRCNISAIEDIEKRYGLTGLDRENLDYLSFRLTDNYGKEYTSVQVVKEAKVAMYRYFRVVADGIDFSEENEQHPLWLRLDIYVEGATDDKAYSSVPIYENHEEYSTFSEFTIKKEGE